MGYSKLRYDSKGNKRYTSVYVDLQGRERSNGTFSTKKESEDAWKDAEALVTQGRGTHLVRGRQRFTRYVNDTWLPNLSVEVKTLESYTYALHAHVMPHFGELPMLGIQADAVRAWLKHLKAIGMSASNRQHCLTLLSSILTSAVKDQVIVGNPCLVVDSDAVPIQPLTIITPEQYEIFRECLPDDESVPYETSQLLIDCVVETGLRWGEVTELRPVDFNFDTDTITVGRAVVQVSRKFHPDGKRFLVKTPKNGKSRRVKIGRALGRRIQTLISARGIDQSELVFRYTPRSKSTPTTLGFDSALLGRTEPNEKGRTYQHGTPSAYTAGKCKCDFCKKAMSVYRAQRRLEGKDDPRRPRDWDTDGHIPTRYFRDRILKPALEKAKLPVDVKMHMLRHAHASWILRGGADIQVVKERLGHAHLSTTERYLHTLDDVDETALSALEKVRRDRGVASKGDTDPLQSTAIFDLNALNAEELLAEMQRAEEHQAQLRKHLLSVVGGA